MIQLIGVVEGIFSSLFLATPLLVSLTNRQKKYKEHNAAVARFREGKADDDHERTAEGKRVVASVASPGMDSGRERTPTTSTWRPNQR